ncbi:MAG: MFS transporter [Leptolyngbyaceae bacterium]|nr:MFS transporter [Leptolyngbyaceae bacterium]
MSSDSSSQPPQSPDSLSFKTKLAFGAGDMGPAITANVLVFFLLYFFTEVARLPPGLAGSILLIGKIADGVNDPIIGYLSDRTESKRWGRRHSWMLYGALPFGILFFLQWIVPPLGDPPANPWPLFLYYVAIGILFNLAFTAVNLPYTALTPELTKNYDERTKLNSFRFAFSIGGSILSVILVIVLTELVSDLRQQYLWIGLTCAVLSTLPIYWCIWGTRRQAMGAEERRLSKPQQESIPLFAQLRIVFSNRAFLFVIGIYLCSWLAVQLTAANLKFFVESWMNLSAQVANIAILAVQGTALLMLFVWSALSEKIGKKAVYGVGMGFWILAQAGLFFLQPGQLSLMYGLAILSGIGVSTAYLIPWSMLPDVIELDELKTGQRREGIFYAFMVLLQKLGLALGLQLVGWSLEWSGYIGGATQQPDSALLAIRIVVGPLPMVCLLIGLVLAYFYPITKDIHAEMLLKLEERRKRDAIGENGTAENGTREDSTAQNDTA